MNRSADLYLASKGVPSAVVFPKARARAVLYAPVSDREAFAPNPAVTPVRVKLQPLALKVTNQNYPNEDAGFVSGSIQDTAVSVSDDAGFITDPVQVVEDYGLVGPTPPILHDSGQITNNTFVTHDDGSIADPITSFEDGGSIV